MVLKGLGELIAAVVSVSLALLLVPTAALLFSRHRKWELSPWLTLLIEVLAAIGGFLVLMEVLAVLALLYHDASRPR